MIDVLLLCREHPPETVAEAVQGVLVADAIDGRAVQLLCRQTSKRPASVTVAVDKQITTVDVPTPSIAAYDQLLAADRSDH